jgi:peroxiredoxin
LSRLIYAFCLGVSLFLSACLESVDNECVSDCQSSGAARTGYPGFGTEVGSIIQPLEFVDSTGETYGLQDVYTQGSNRVLLLTTSAGWCTACIEEQSALQTLYGDYAGQGVEIMVTVFEKGDYEPADANFAKQWKRRYQLTYPVVADPPFIMRSYYPGGDSSVTPILLVIDVENMTIIERFVGFDDIVVRALIDGLLSGSS